MSAYYGVIGNRDSIKLRGEKRPFWEFLDKHPDGWLSSLAYPHHPELDNRRNLRAPGYLPMSMRRPMILDCGAWTYKQLDVPTLKKSPVTAAWALEQYRTRMRDGDILVAPDHMIIPGLGDPTHRRRFNTHQARAFLDVVDGDPSVVPMATVHGLDLAERLRTAERYQKMGYRHLALGGLAGQASRRAVCVEMVVGVRSEFPDIYLHVLGLSSPSFAAIWSVIGVNSFDGSSHFKQAFAGGAFFMAEGAKMIKYQAVRPGETPTAPECECWACVSLRADGIDTRTYGSNENNMGRAAHNMNHLMLAQEAAIHQGVTWQSNLDL